MAGFNRVTLIGNLTRDPQSKVLPSGITLCEFGLAVNRKFKNAIGEEKDDVCFVDCTAYGKPADVLQEYCRKGKQLFIEGRLKYDTWDDKNGGKRSKLTVVVENFQFLGHRDDADSGDAPAAPLDRSTDQTRPTGERRQWKPTQNRLFGPGTRERARGNNPESPVATEEQFTEADIPF